MGRVLSGRIEGTMKAASAEQLKLVELQELDQKLAKLRHQKKSMPVLVQISELEKEKKSVLASQVALKTRAHDALRAQRAAENDVDQVTSRQKLQQDRLDSGQASHKELSALQGELAQLARRREELETAALSQLERAEKLEQQLREASAVVQDIEAKINQKQSQCGEEASHLEEQIAALSKQRELVSANIDGPLLDEYERIASRTGGVGIVCVRGRNVVDSNIDFSPAEWEEIRSAAPDEVIYSEEYEYLIVRLPKL
ncbi:hypothetical protein QP689_10515 [Winkia neuii]|nr:hypothetical protein [Winkia neuii]